jgi:UDP-N-acetylglucosamine:LPS N-acetylglucosamine transferase
MACLIGIVNATVYAKAERRAVETGLDPRIAHQLMQAMVEGSHMIQELRRAADRTQQRAADDPQTILIVGGAGRMGQLFERQFVRARTCGRSL